MMTVLELFNMIGSELFSDFVSKVVSDGIDISKKAIKNADYDRKSYNRNLQTQIYDVIVDSLNEFTCNRHRGEDRLYYAAESILKGIISSQNTTDAVKSGLKDLVSTVNDDICNNFLEKLCIEICKDKNNDLYKEICLIWEKEKGEYLHNEFKRSNENDKKMLGELIDLKEDVGFIKERVSDRKCETDNYNEMYIMNRAEEYADKWEKNVFLNDFNERDEADIGNVKLKNIYLEDLLPHYIWRANKNPYEDLKELLHEYIVDNNAKKMLLILGQPGIGKSTLITWIAANYRNKRGDISVYQFASDLKNIDWENDNILNVILKTTGMRTEELENKVLILDGFDEMRIDGGRERILNQIYQGLAELSFIKHFSLIITCRENFVYELQKVECDYITLQTWDNVQIHSFCRAYEKESGQTISRRTINKILENKEILGIPLILYMVLALNITIEENGSIADVYDQIFSLDGGSIYDRCIKNSSFAKPHRISEAVIKKQIHKISQKIAFWIFENNSEQAFIPQISYEKICNAVIDETEEKNENVKKDFLIGNYFKLIKHCEGVGSDDLQFVHRSIYEYFVSEYFFESICNITEETVVIGELATLLKDGRLTEQILEFIKYKFNRHSMQNLPYIIKNIFQIMLHDSMTYYLQERCNNVIEREINIFANMLEMVRLWNQSLGEPDNQIISYLQYNSRSKLNLQGIKLAYVNLRRVYLDGANLNDADLNGVNLEKSEMNGAKLREAQLNGANLQRADLGGADLIGAYLRNAHLDRANLKEADLSGADLIGAKFPNANLEGAELIRARLINADLRGAKLNNAKFSTAELNGADLREAEVYGTEMNGAYLRDAIFDERQVAVLNGKCDFSGSKVYVFAINEVISYEAYCITRQK